MLVRKIILLKVTGVSIVYYLNGQKWLSNELNLSNNKKLDFSQPETDCEFQLQSKTSRKPWMLSLFLRVSVMSGRNSIHLFIKYVLQ